MNENNKFIGESRITPYLTVRDAKKAISFYEKHLALHSQVMKSIAPICYMSGSLKNA